MSFDKKFMATKNLPPAPQVPKGANYILWRKSGKLLFLAGNGPLRGSKIPPKYIGKLGRQVSTKQGYAAAKLTAMNLLLTAREALGSLNKVSRIISVDGTVNCLSTYKDQPAVINGCSDFLVEIFGEKGKHTRSAMGTNSLAFDICCEISMIIKIK